MTDGMKERAQELGRLLGQSDEYKALGRARQRLTDDQDAVGAMTRLDTLEREISTALHSGQEPEESAKQEKIRQAKEEAARNYQTRLRVRSRVR